MHTRSQTTLISRGPNITALRQLLTELLTDPDNVRRIADLMAGADTAYDMHPRRPAHPLVGHWVPNLELDTPTGPSRVAKLLRAGRPVLLDFADLTGLVVNAEVAAGWRDRVDVVHATAVNPPADGMLIRPDGHVAWAVGPECAGSVDDLAHALGTWFGQPVEVLSSAGAAAEQR